MKCEERYFELYGKEPESIAFCPYRIAPLGAHIDHQNGSINGFAIDKGIHIAYGVKDSGICEIRSLNFPKRAQFHVNAIPEQKVGDWADHCRAAAKMLGEKYPLRKRISEALDDGCGYDAPGSFAAWLSKHVDMHAWKMPGKRYDIGDVASYEAVKEKWNEKSAAEADRKK